MERFIGSIEIRYKGENIRYIVGSGGCSEIKEVTPTVYDVFFKTCVSQYDIRVFKPMSLRFSYKEKDVGK